MAEGADHDPEIQGNRKTESTRWHCPRGIVLLPLVDMNVRVPYNLIWKKDNSSPLLHKFVCQVEADKVTREG
jgi:hypothetical protein